jgi:hypothetical protein
MIAWASATEFEVWCAHRGVRTHALREELSAKPSRSSIPISSPELLHGCYMVAQRAERRRPRKLLNFRGLAVVAGAGFEPATFGL